MWRILVIFLIFDSIKINRSSPFQLTEKYLEDFKNGLENFHKTIEEYQFEPHKEYHPELYNEEHALIEAENYDFIIVGGGTSGAVLANRLSEIPEWKILLLEAGDYENEYMKIPKYYKLNQLTKYNWNFMTVPQTKWCYGRENKQCKLINGKGLGGTTLLNNMFYTRGNQYDFDLWADLNNTEWCYQDILPYYKKLEDANLIKFDQDYHQQGGLFHIENPNYLTKLHEIIFKAGEELNLTTNIDYNGIKQDGLSLLQLNIKNGKRQSTYEAYLKPILAKRKNLKILPNSYVIEILIAPHTKHVQGIKFIHNNELKIAKIDKEVILSAGPINTPKLLMLSGIGPKDDLEQLGIETIKDLKVGQHLKDHISYIGLDFYYHSNNNNNNTDDDKDQDLDAQILEYLKNDKGPLTSNGYEVIGYLKSELNKMQQQPDIEISISQRKLTKHELELNLNNYQEEIIENLWSPLIDHYIINFGITLTHPKSIGSIRLKSKNPFDDPLIDLNHLSDIDNHDINKLLDGIKKVLEFSNTETFKQFDLHLNKNHLQLDCKDYEWGTDDYWKCTIHYLTNSLNHITSTTSMGPSYDKNAIVNNKLQVYGIDGLRIIDTSIIPITITGHIMAPTIMVAEKGADLIKEHWK